MKEKATRTEWKLKPVLVKEASGTVCQEVCVLQGEVPLLPGVESRTGKLGGGKLLQSPDEEEKRS